MLNEWKNKTATVQIASRHRARTECNCVTPGESDPEEKRRRDVRVARYAGPRLIDIDVGGFVGDVCTRSDGDLVDWNTRVDDMDVREW